MCNRMTSTWCHLIQRHINTGPNGNANATGSHLSLAILENTPSFAHYNMFLSNIYICYDREMREMTTTLQTLVPNVVAAATVPSSRQKDSMTSTDQQGARRRKRHKKEFTTRATIAPPSTSVHGLKKSVDSSMPGTVTVIRVLSMDSQTAGKCHISSSTTCSHSLVQPQRIPVSCPWPEVFYYKHQWNYVRRHMCGVLGKPVTLTTFF